ncbi:hypothetical protein FOA52_000635 [Chlamydomonas sp. UWO 241]|nr:hypothetical protein FOA52_000635 [Chlamydomonas sp. UWO 241]
MTQAPEAPLPCVQNFQVHKLLGKGSYGKVYKVQREIDAQFYALKECDLGTMTHTERMNAVSEVRLLVSMNHPSVIRYHEAFLSGNKLCTVMEYAPFGDLKYYIDKGNRLSTPFPEEAVWRLFLQLCQGLSAIHAAKIIHRDIKPANIFLCKNDVLKIGDLGVAKALERLDFAKTQIGTPVYMAPEVWTGKQYSYSSDLWSLGCVLYEMMTFRLPVEARSLAELRSKVSRGKYTPLSPSSGIYSSELISMCHALLTVDPNRRPTLDMILQSPAASKWLGCLPSQAAPLPRRWSECGTGGGQGAGGLDRSQSQQLIKAIVMPRDIRNLPKLLLPPPSYEPLPPLPPASHSRKATAPDGDQATAAAAAAVAYGRLPAHSPDGIPVDVWRKLGEPAFVLLAAVFTAVGATGEMPPGFLDGVVASIYKAKDAADAANYRPLTMLGSDYRILAKVLATRWTPLLAAVVGPEQTAFLAGRRISDNTCLTQMLPGLLAANAAEGVGPTGAALALLDFRKAYDTIDRGCLLAVMEAVGVGDGVLAWTRTILTHTYASAEVNGFISEPRRYAAGVRQGCPAAPALFLFLGHALACFLRTCPAVGVEVVPGCRVTCPQYADDCMPLLRSCAPADVAALVEAMAVFGRATGLVLNLGKCGILPLGSAGEGLLAGAEVAGLRVLDAGVSLGVPVSAGLPPPEAVTGVCAGLRTLEAAVPGLWRLPLLSACKEPIWRLWVWLLQPPAGVRAGVWAVVAALVVDAMERGCRHLWRITRPRDGVLPPDRTVSVERAGALATMDLWDALASFAEGGVMPRACPSAWLRMSRGGTGRREPADGGVVSASLLNAKPAVGGIGVEPRGGGVLRVLFTVASDAVADTVVRWRHELRRCVDSTAVFDVLSDREEAQHQALWPAFLAAKVAGKRAQFHRARLVDGERVPAPAC